MRTAICDGRFIDPANRIDTLSDVFIADGRIVGLGHPPDGFAAERRINARQQIVCPGLIDLCARLREPGHEHKATIASETRAAAAATLAVHAAASSKPIPNQNTEPNPEQT